MLSPKLPSLRPVFWQRAIAAVFAQLLIAGLVPQRVSALEWAPEEVERTIETIVSERAKLQRGVFRATARIVHAYDEQARQLPTKVYCVFDTPGKRWRFERRGQMLINIQPGSELTAEVIEEIRSGRFNGRARPRDFHTIQVRSPEYMTEWYCAGHPGEPNSVRTNIELRDPGQHTTYRHHLLFHPSTVGLLEPSEFRRGGRSIEQILESFRERTPHVTLEVQPDGSLTLVFRGDRLRRTIWIDPAQGFTVRRMLFVALGDDGEPMELPRIESTADWELKQGVWVPVRFLTGYYHENGRVDAHECDLTWEAVNPPADSLDPKLFTYQSFEGVWDYVRVFDRRSGERLYIETFGVPPEKFIGMKRGAGPPAGPPPPEASTSRMLWLIVLNLVAVGFIAAFFVWQRSRSRT